MFVVLADESHIPLYDELIKNFPVQYIAGGATQNSIRVAQWMLQVPGATAFFGAIGHDAYGETLGNGIVILKSDVGVIVVYFPREMCS